MVDIPLTASQRWRSLAAAIGVTSIVGTAMGLTWPLLALVLDRQGVGGALIGLSSSCQTLAILAVSPLAPRIIAALGMTRAMTACIAAIVLALLLLPLLQNFYAWIPIRFALGAGVAILFIAGETWVNAVTLEATRGRTIGVFGFLWAAGFGIGPLLIRVTGIEGWTPFLVAVALILAASAPLPFARDAMAHLAGPPAVSMTRLVRLAPAALLATGLLGTIDAVNDTFLPLYGLRNGLGQNASVTVLAAVMAGLTAAQIPIGWLADRVDRRALLRLMAAATLALALVLPLAIRSEIWIWPLAAAWGAAIGGIWAVSLVLLGERFRGHDLVAANAVRGVLYGIGSAAGPTLGGAALHVWSPHGALLVIIAACLAYLASTLLRDRPL